MKNIVINTSCLQDILNITSPIEDNCIIRSNIVFEIYERYDHVASGRTRYSIGRTDHNIKLHTSEFIYDDKPENIIQRLDKKSIYKNYTNFPDLSIPYFCSFIKTLSAGSLRIECTNKHFHYGKKIISREITNYIEIKMNQIILKVENKVMNIFTSAFLKLHLLKLQINVFFLSLHQSEYNDPTYFELC